MALSTRLLHVTAKMSSVKASTPRRPDPEQEEAIDEEACDVAVGRDTGTPDEVRKEVDDVGECEDDPPAEELVEEVVCETCPRQA